MMNKECFYITNLIVKHLLIFYHRQRTKLDAGGFFFLMKRLESFVFSLCLHRGDYILHIHNTYIWQRTISRKYKQLL